MHTRATEQLIDLHCDTLTECAKRGIGLINKQLHFSLDRIPSRYRLCQAMAVFLPDELRGEAAWNYFLEVHRVFLGELHAHGGALCQVTDTGRIEEALEARPVAALLSVEGGAVLGGRLRRVEELYRMGVRMMTLTWNAANEICGGAATDEGFSPFGRQVVGEMERLGMAVDVSHLSDRGFYQLCEFAGRPFVASHSNARAVCPHRRNLTDEMFRQIRDRGGLVGLNFYRDFLVEGGRTESVDDLLRHVHHFLDLGGADILALGSDFDGAELPAYLGGVEKLEELEDALLRSGLSQTVVTGILYRNAQRYFAALAHSRRAVSIETNA